MGYLKIIAQYPPYAQMKDRRGFISKKYGNGHLGIDSVGNQWDNEVCAIVDGTVQTVYNDPCLGHTVEYGNDRVRVRYCHLKKATVKAGERVESGKTIVGVEGNTGNASKGKHLHLELKIDGKNVDPEPFLTGKSKFPLPETKGELNMKYQIGDKVFVKGKIAPSAYSAMGTVSRTDLLTVTKIYKGTNFPYQLGVVGFAREEDMEMANPKGEAQTVTKEEYDRLAEQLKKAEQKICAARQALE